MKQLLASRRFVFKALLAVGLLLPFMSSSKDAPVFVRKVEGISEYSLSNGLQILLIPEVVEMDEPSVSRLAARSEELAKLGLVLEAFGPGAVVVRETPGEYFAS